MPRSPNASDLTQEAAAVKVPVPDSWVVADPRSQRFGKPFADAAAIAAGARRGTACLVSTEEGVLLLEQTTARSASEYQTAYQARAEAAGYGNACMGMTSSFSRQSSGAASSVDMPAAGHWDRLSQLGQLDMFALRPAFVQRRIFIGLAFVVVYVYFITERCYVDRPPAAGLLLGVTLGYPLLLYLVGHLMHKRARPMQRYVFEVLLALDLYQLVTSAFIFFAVLRESWGLGLLLPPWGNDASISSPFLRKLLWLHYHNRIVELLDMVVRICQKKFKAYGALHLYLRLLFLWCWLAACRVGGGDAYFYTLLDAGVTSVRFLVFTTSILRWNWNVRIDFGMHAPKMALFRKEHLYHLQVCEFGLLILHSLYCGYWNTMSRTSAAIQVLVMLNGMSIFTDFQHSRDTAAQVDSKQAKDARMTFSFDSSCWLFLYHFGVAAWIQDHVNVTMDDFAFSGSSGGALVAAVLACELDAVEAKDMALADFPLCQRNPFMMFKIGEKLLDHYLRDTELHDRCNGRLRVLLTKVSWMPPIMKAEVATKFRSWREVFCCLRASMHVPMAAGVLPYPVPGRGWYYDGLLWASLFVPWRAVDDTDEVVKVSACGFPGAQLGPRVPFPILWLVMPPSADVLQGIFWMGYRDTGDYFSGQAPKGFTETSFCERRQPEAPAQVRALRKHLKKDPRERLDEAALRFITDVQATAWRHWCYFFAAMSVFSTALAALAVGSIT